LLLHPYIETVHEMSGESSKIAARTSAIACGPYRTITLYPVFSDPIRGDAREEPRTPKTGAALRSLADQY